MVYMLKGNNESLREISNIRDIQSDIKELQKAAEKVEEPNEVTVNELFPPEFMKKYSNFNQIEEFLEQSPVERSSNSESYDVSRYDPEFDEYIKRNTAFKSWEEMKERGTNEWIAKQLNF